jgi:hypothetical protein
MRSCHYHATAWYFRWAEPPVSLTARYSSSHGVGSCPFLSAVPGAVFLTVYPTTFAALA